jgi:hypothetical protein
VGGACGDVESLGSSTGRALLMAHQVRVLRKAKELNPRAQGACVDLALRGELARAACAVHRMRPLNLVKSVRSRMVRISLARASSSVRMFSTENAFLPIREC